MCKITEGLTISDPTFVSNWNAMWELNRTMPRFGYQFFHASDDPVRQAERFVATVKPHGLLPDVPRPWSRWTFWQKGDSPVDTDRFSGTEAQLLSFTRMPRSR